MRNILTILLVLAFSGKTIAADEITIFVKESSYFIDSSKESLSAVELEEKLKHLQFSSVTLDVDYCAIETLAYAYVAISNAKPSVTDIKLKASGNHEESKCNDV